MSRRVFITNVNSRLYLVLLSIISTIYLRRKKCLHTKLTLLASRTAVHIDTIHLSFVQQKDPRIENNCHDEWKPNATRHRPFCRPARDAKLGIRPGIPAGKKI